MKVLALVGALFVVWFAVMCFGTVVDISQRAVRWMRGDKNAWKIDQELEEEGATIDQQIIPQLSFWSALERFVEVCRDHGEFLSEKALSINLEKVPAEDVIKLSKVNSPIDSVERQLNLLFARYNVTHLIEVRREKNLLHLCSPSW